MTEVQALDASLNKLLATTKASLSSISSNLDNSSSKTKARIAELRDEDKSKIAKLIQQLSKEHEENGNISSKLRVAEQRLAEEVQRRKIVENELRTQQEIFENENEELKISIVGLKKKFAQSLIMLKAYQARLGEMDAKIETLEKIPEKESLPDIKILQEQVSSLQAMMLNRAEIQVEMHPDRPPIKDGVKINQANIVEDVKHEDEVEKQSIQTKLELIEAEVEKERIFMSSSIDASCRSRARYETKMREYDVIKKELDVRNEGVDAFLLQGLSNKPTTERDALHVDQTCILESIGVHLYQRENSDDEPKKPDDEDTALESFLRMQRVKSTKDDETDSIVFDAINGGYLDPESFENSQFDNSLFDLVDELEAHNN